MIEIWKPISGFEDRYEVSDSGRVRNALGRVLRTAVQNSGYQIVHLALGRRHKRKPMLVHRAVAIAFLPLTGNEVNHKDGNKLNNSATNLEWVNRSQNMQHAARVGLLVVPRNAVVGRHLVDGSEIHFNSQLAAEIHFRGKATSAVHRCIEGKCRSAYGYQWRRT